MTEKHQLNPVMEKLDIRGAGYAFFFLIFFFFLQNNILDVFFE